MNSDDKERRRAEQLSREQLKARDPGASKIRGYDWSQHARKGAAQNKKRKPFLAELFGLFPGRWKGVMIGFPLALVPTVLIISVTEGEWRVLALLPPLIFCISGYVLGGVTEKHI